MSNRKRLTRITIEQHEVRITRRRAERVTAYCEQCGSIVTALIPETTDAIQIPQDEIHFIDTAGNDRRLLCDGSVEGTNTTIEEKK